MAITPLNYGQDVVVEIRIQNNLLPALYPNAKKTEVIRGTLQKSASYDGRDTIRVVSTGDRFGTVHVIPKKRIVTMNGRPFWYTPTPVKKFSGEKRTVTVKGSTGADHHITIYPDGHMTCDCVGFGYRRKCGHIDKLVAGDSK